MLVRLDAVAQQHAGVADVDERQPAIRRRAAGPAGGGQADLVDEALAAGRLVAAGDHRQRGRHRQPGLCQAVPVAQLGEGALDRVGEPVGEIGRGGRARVRVLDAAGDRARPDLEADRAEAAGVRRDRLRQRVEDADHRRGLRAGLAEVEAALQRIDVVAQVHRHPRLGRVDLDRGFDDDSLGCDVDRIVAPLELNPPGGKTRQRRPHPLLAVVEPALRLLVDRLPTEPVGELGEPPLADPGGAEQGEVVAPPLVGNADPGAAHADHVVDVLVVALHPDAGEDQGAFLVDVTRARHVGGRLRVADVGLVPLGDDGEPVRPLRIQHRHQDRVVGRVRPSLVG